MKLELISALNVNLDEFVSLKDAAVKHVQQLGYFFFERQSDNSTSWCLMTSLIAGMKFQTFIQRSISETCQN